MAKDRNRDRISEPATLLELSSNKEWDLYRYCREVPKQDP